MSFNTLFPDEPTASKIHDFQECIELSKRYANAPWWKQVYRKAFPGFAGMVYVNDDGWAQRAGIDRVITLRSGKTLQVDEKVRESDWPDFLLERWSDRDRKSHGWIQKDLSCDFIAYAYIPSQTCYLLPFQQLRTAWRVYGRKWIELAEQRSHGYRVSLAKNNGYTTEGICVPREVVLDALIDVMTIRWERE